MPPFRVRRLESLEQLAGHARPWDELWRRSSCALPIARADTIALWCRQFATQARFCAWVVEADGRFVAALPLIERPALGQCAGTLTGDLWSTCGDFLLDAEAGTPAVCDSLVAALRGEGWPILWFDAIPAGTAYWKSLLDAFERSKATLARKTRFTIPVVELAGDWDAYVTSRSRNHRRQIRRAQSRALAEGSLELKCYDDLSPDKVESVLQVCFDLEASGWKHSAGSAIVNVPGMRQFFIDQSKQLAHWRQLCISILEHAGQPIAFELGYRAKGTYFSPKIGYDEAFSHLSPGQLLRGQLIERFLQDGDVREFDFLGPASEATAKWGTREYAVDRVVIGLRGVVPRALVMALDAWWKARRKLRGQNTVDAKASQEEPAVMQSAQGKSSGEAAPLETEIATQ